MIFNNLPACRHSWACGFIANRKPIDRIHLLDHLKHCMKQTILFDNCIPVTRRVSLAPILQPSHGEGLHTLMGQPFSQFHILRAGTECQEVAPYVQRGIFLLEEVFGSIGIVGGGVVRRQRRSKRRGAGMRRCLGRMRHRRLNRSSVVHLGNVGIVVVATSVVILVVTSSAKSLATRNPSNHESIP